MSGTGGVGTNQQVIRPSEVSLRNLVPGGRVNTDTAFDAKGPLGVGADILNVRHRESGGLETISLDVEPNWGARKLGAQRSRVTVEERLDASGSVTGVKGQLYARLTMTSLATGKQLDAFDARVSQSASGTVTLSPIDRKGAISLGNGKASIALGTISVAGRVTVSD